ncbi:MAG: hypothetical protein Q3M30_02060 [Candidatus Electrothrix sp. Rat3]|nr:hypothetical protein [Candidatus Electrothrix rattekaaiensis]
MKSLFLVFAAFFHVFLFAVTGYSANKGVDSITKTFFNLDVTYRASFDLDKIIDKGGDCNAPSVTYSTGKDSIFRELSSDENVMIVTFDYVTGNGTVDIDKPYKVCGNQIPSYKYKRVGGIDVGALVIPFKIRSGNLYGDSTLGPYIAFKGNYISLLATFGMTQVSVSDISTAEVEAASGISYAVGAVWSVTDTFDIGLVAGIDHVSGEAGDKFEHQDDVWWSFAIGYNFTTGL